ncbi:hypothetical protein PIB30_016502 [Stylosanthes scabra]|uniref:Uncharacterized protein n=1 Tax=Stylosanthes scabra TaxID=79078 RepID=A0ABU6Z940_9FABA|nr:hypothetical protein [Stylosanthes scabra]
MGKPELIPSVSERRSSLRALANFGGTVTCSIEDTLLMVGADDSFNPSRNVAAATQHHPCTTHKDITSSNFVRVLLKNKGQIEWFIKFATSDNSLQLTFNFLNPPLAEDAFHQLPSNKIPSEATQRQSALHPLRSLWVEDMMDDDADVVVPTGCVRWMPEGGTRWRGMRGERGGRGQGEGGDMAPSQQSQGCASTNNAYEAGTSMQVEIPATPRS